MNLAARIELYLLQAGGFVPTREICERFEIAERNLRAKGGEAGLLDDFAVSSTAQGQSGFIHHRHLPEEAFSSIAGRIRQHGIAELRKIKHWKQARHNVLTGKRPDLREVHSGQMLLLPV